MIRQPSGSVLLPVVRPRDRGHQRGDDKSQSVSRSPHPFMDKLTPTESRITANSGAVHRARACRRPLFIAHFQREAPAAGRSRMPPTIQPCNLAPREPSEARRTSSTWKDRSPNSASRIKLICPISTPRLKLKVRAGVRPLAGLHRVCARCPCPPVKHLHPPQHVRDELDLLAPRPLGRPPSGVPQANPITPVRSALANHARCQGVLATEQAG